MSKFTQIFKIKKSCKNILIVAILLICYTFFVNIADAQETFDLLGIIEGEGTHFKIIDSQYLNITLDSSEQIKARIESIPEMITIMIENSSSTVASSTQISLSGFNPLTTYYKYQDDYHDLTEFIADENGGYSYIQDLSKPHFIFIQPRKSTKFIRDDATGGDCYLIGNWNGDTKTCTLAQDIYETIQIDSNSIVLDGNDRTLTGSNTGYGVYLYGRSGVTIKNLNVRNFTYGIYFYSSDNNNLTDNGIFNTVDGVYINYFSNNNTISRNNFSFNDGRAIYLYGSNNNLINNTIDGPVNSYYDYSSSIGIRIESSDNLIEQNTISHNHFGIVVFGARNNLISNIINTNRSRGIYISGSYGGHNKLISNVISGNSIGIQITGNSNENELTSNTISNNRNWSASYLGWGIALEYSNNHKVYNNNIIDNPRQTIISNSVDNIFNFVPPIGGNYWSNFDTPSEGCNDLNNDNFCDSPYVFDMGRDNSPWIIKDGWNIPINQPPTISNINQYKSDDQTLISESGITAESTVVFKATLNDADNDQAKLQIELKEFNQPFDGQNLLESDFMNSGSEAVVSRGSLVVGSYKWHARAVDNKGNTSQWQEFGTVGNVDFIVKTLQQAAADLAKEVINAPYLGDGDTYGGKGWDPVQALYVSSNEVFNGYNFWNNNINKRKVEFGAGLDCSGLTQWAYNRSFDSTKSLLYNAIRWGGADGQYKNNTKNITETDLKIGDLLFLDKDNNNRMDHVAMYVGESDSYDIVEAFSPERGIVSSGIIEFKERPGFVESKHFRRVVISPSIGGFVKAGSPIDLIVTNSDGFTITSLTAIQTDEEYLREIPGELYYLENELGPDGRPEDVIYWPTQKAGDYIIKVVPEAGVSPTETYNLEFQTGNQTILLADSVPISQAPIQGYGISVTETGTLNSFVPILIDIKPDSYQNSINLGSNGVIPVAIFGSATFDVKQIDPDTVKLANSLAKIKGNGQLMASYSDVNEDGFTDILLNVATEALQLTENDVKANLEGRLINGEIIKGSDSIRIVP